MFFLSYIGGRGDLPEHHLGEVEVRLRLPVLARKMFHYEWKGQDGSYTFSISISILRMWLILFQFIFSQGSAGVGTLLEDGNIRSEWVKFLSCTISWLEKNIQPDRLPHQENLSRCCSWSQTTVTRWASSTIPQRWKARDNFWTLLAVSRLITHIVFGTIFHISFAR